MGWTSVYERLIGSATIHPIKPIFGAGATSAKRQSGRFRQIDSMLTMTGTQ
ncbi:MAG TPA: hypothetical protein VL527_03490 [Dongiaceae bacterium]|nr:hypothetical protein [Dongiaceae bacterium]